MIVSLARYRVITRDTTTAEAVATGALVEAQRMIEDDILHRPLEWAERVERLPVSRLPDDWRGRAYPRAVPVTAVPVGSDYQVESTAALVNVNATPFDAVTGVSGWSVGCEDTALVTYSGGYRGVDDPAVDDLTRIPTTLERAIANLARSLGRAQPVDVPAGVTSATVGDVSVTYAAPTGGDVEALQPGITRNLRAYAYRPYA